MKHIVYSILSLGLSSPALAAPILWEPAEDVTGPTSVLHAGDSIEAVNLTPHTTNDVEVNGVIFRSELALFGQTYPNQALAGHTTGDSSLDELLNGFDHGSTGAATVQIGGGALLPGRIYVVQVVMTDLRRLDLGDRGQILGDGLGDEVHLDARGSDPGVGSFGTTAIGVFIADDVNQTLTITPTGTSSNAHLTAYQIREVEPHSMVVNDVLVADQASSLLTVGYTPGEWVAFVASDRRGDTDVPGCPGSVVSQRSPRLIGSAIADANGSARIVRAVPASSVGDRLHLQSGELGACVIGPRRDVDVD